MKLGILGGTFDPVHVAHLLLGEEARDQLALDKVIFLPAGQPWRKLGRIVSSGEHRLAMLRLAVADDAGSEVSAVEMARPGATYTVETLVTLKEEQPGAELYLIIGEDALIDLPQWREPERIVELATLAVARRGETSHEAAGPQIEGLRARLSWLSMPRIDVSASEIRERVRSGRSIRYLVPAAVERYIREHDLYQA